MPMQPPIATAPKYVKARSFDKADTFNQKAMDIAKKRNEKKVDLQRQLSENTAKMAIIEKAQIA